MAVRDAIMIGEGVEELKKKGGGRECEFTVQYCHLSVSVSVSV
jgi:hypothetical protein